MTLEKLPVYVNIFPDGRETISCAHCAIDAQLEGARVTTLYAESDPPGSPGRFGIVWESDLTPEQLIAAAAQRCKHLATYGRGQRG